MSNELTSYVTETCATYGNDRTRMMDIVIDVQAEFGCVSGQALDLIAAAVGTHRVEVESVVSFYAFLSDKPKGTTVIRLCNDIIDRQHGADRVGQALSQELGIAFGETTEDGTITLEHTPCIGMCDQAPALMINDIVITNVNGERAGDIARTVKEHGSDHRQLVRIYGDGNNGHELIQAMVWNNIRKRGPVVFADFTSGTALKKALAMTPAEVIRDMKTSRLRGRGGAGFPTGMKWDFTRQADGDKRTVICNADEGEPGTFKDRVILTECADVMLEGMTIAGYAISADTGILYLRGEYAYLRRYLEQKLQDRREAGLLGKNAGGKEGFDYDIRIQMGAGAYICGEETALISSCEGLRGDPKNRPPFPAQKGYLATPTTVNNAETFCCVARILDQGPGWFAQMGSKGSAGTKVLSVCGDCASPGIYEIPFGTTIREMLAMVGADDVKAIQMGGPSGSLIGEADFDRTICYDDVATGGSVMVFNSQRDILEVVHAFMDFFVEESCGYCTPCRVGNSLIKSKLEDIMQGRGTAADLDYLKTLGGTVKTTSRCGSIERFPEVYAAKLQAAREDDFLASFDIKDALTTAEGLTGRKSVIFN